MIKKKSGIAADSTALAAGGLVLPAFRYSIAAIYRPRDENPISAGGGAADRSANHPRRLRIPGRSLFDGRGRLHHVSRHDRFPALRLSVSTAGNHPVTHDRRGRKG